MAGLVPATSIVLRRARGSGSPGQARRWRLMCDSKRMETAL